MKTLKKALAVVTASMAISAPASAGIFTYDVQLDRGVGAATLVVDSAAATATYTGANINLTLTSSQLLGFTGEDTSTTRYFAEDISGTLVHRGTEFDAVFASTGTKNVSFKFGEGSSSVWTSLEDSVGNTRGFDVYGATVLNNSTTTSSSSSSTSGGTPPGVGGGGGSVPVPATALLILVGLAGVGVGMRRKKATV